jgi:predicted phage terminase large subunit-like protein
MVISTSSKKRRKSSHAPSATLTLPALTEIEAERCKRSLYTYVQRSWDIVEQAVPFVDNWHIGLMCEYLEALYYLQIQNLIINIPPGHAKSLICSVFFPTWVWINTPSARFFCGSHAKDLATRDAVRSRRLLESDWYQERFGDVFQLAGDQNVKTRYENDKTGHRVSVGVDAGWTGHRGNYLVWDDPLDKTKKDSDTERDNANEAVKSSFATRGDNPKEIRRLLIMQRLHDDDPTGHLLQAMNDEEAFPRFEQCILPARYEPNRFFSSIGLKDPRTKLGELLFPQLFDEKVVSDTEILLGIQDAAGQLQQRPAPKGGSIYLSEWWDAEKNPQNRYDPSDTSIFNRAIARWIFYDTAFKDKEQNDTNARVIFELLPDYRILLREAWWRRLQVPQVTDDVNQNTRRWKYDGKLRATVVEDKGSGTAVLQTLRQGADPEIVDFLQEFNPGTASKPERGRKASVWCDRGCVLLPMPHESVPWLHDFEDLLFKFPAAKIDDPPDAFSMGILFLENLLAEGWRFRLGLTGKKR